MAEKVCKHFWVSGRVQGVWFRDGTKKTAQKLGVTGWVRNLPDGRVEVMVCGTSEQLEQMEAWLQRGSELARVDELQSETLSWHDYEGFVITQ